MNPDLHPLLLRQLKKLGLGHDQAPIDPTWQVFLQRVSETYHEEDRGRYLLERSLGLSSSEMQQLNAELQTSLQNLDQEKKKLESTNLELARVANTDSLTNLPNRAYFRSYLEQALNRTASDALTALFFIDLDGFKYVNDTFGHSFGDLLLKQAALRLSEHVRKTDLVARLGGDEFTIVLEGLPDIDKATQIADQILSSFAHPFVVQGRECMITCSIGIAAYPSDTPDLEALIQSADAAMYDAKDLGKNQYSLFNKESNLAAVERMLLLQNMRKGLENREFFLLYQPRVNLDNGKLVSVEALVRWKNAERGMVSPGAFIPLAEETGLIHPLGDYVLIEACQQAKQWSQMGHPLRVAVNISVHQLQREDFLDKVEAVLAETDLDPRLLELEITESTAMTNVESNIAKLSKLREMGIYISVDDFGTAYSSLSYLRKLPINSLKIDRSFIQDIEPETLEMGEIGRAIVRSVIALGQNLNLSLVAEGVETAGQINFLREAGCLEAQGFYFCKPVGVAEITKRLEAVGSRYEAVGTRQ